MSILEKPSTVHDETRHDWSSTDTEENEVYDYEATHTENLPFAQATYLESLHAYVHHDIRGCAFFSRDDVPKRNMTKDATYAAGGTPLPDHFFDSAISPLTMARYNTLPGGGFRNYPHVDDMCRGCGDRIDGKAKQTLLMEKEWFAKRRERIPVTQAINFHRWESTHCTKCVESLTCWSAGPGIGICIGCHGLLKDGKCPGMEFVPWFLRGKGDE